ncbi:hypothetical protein L5515_003271 [Caenorhabditis briggsae]|uniref:Tyrosine-protein phosphatase domain-containing protein n=1 Tax=Caenorhabditis briggsae TaxID=6238 RepID=A0AAE9EED8_CAEBR|nr:hypothetical protein L5515_003271 [Caenorhabditis briggsae]
MKFRKKIVYLLLVLGSTYLSDKLTAAANRIVYQRQLSPYPDNPPLGSSSGNHDLDVKPNSNSLQYPDHHALSDTDPQRSRRNSNDSFDTSVELLLKASRVINGIALQQGLSTGTITPNALISDLLNLESVTSIESINSDDFTTLIDAVKDIPQKLVTDAEIEKMEERFLIYSDAIDRTNGMEKGVTIPGMDEYLTGVNKLKSASFNDADLKAPSVNLKGLLKNLKVLKTESDSTEILSKFDLLRTYTGKIMKLSMEPLKVDAVLKNTKSALGPLFTVNEVLQKFEDNAPKLNYVKSKDSPVMKKVGSNVEVLESFSKSASSLQSKTRSLYQIFTGRLHQSGNRKLSCTAGFADGVLDLGLVSGDLKDEWVKKAVKGQSDSLAKALDQLGPLQLNTQAAASSLRLADGDKSALESLTNLVASVPQADGSLNDLSSSIEKFFITKSISDMSPTNMQEFQTIFNYINALSEHLNAIKAAKEMASVVAKDEAKYVSTILEIIKDATDADAQTKLGLLFESSAFKKLINVLESGAKSYEVLTKKDENGNAPKSVIDMAKEIDTKKAEIQKYIDGLIPFLQEIDKLRKLPGSKALGAAIRAIREHRKSVVSVPDVQQISGWVKTAKTTLSSLENSVKEMGGMKSIEKDALASTNKILKDSQAIGSSARVFRGMKMILETSLDLDDVQMEKVRKYLVEISDPKDRKNLEDLMALDQKINTLKQEVNQVRSSIKPPKSPDFISLNEVIQAAKGSSGIPMDFFAIGKSVEKMSEQLKDRDLLKIKKVIDQLDTFGLDFARHKTAIGASKAALGNVDLLFVAYGKAMHKPSKKSDDKKVLYISLGATAGFLIIATLTVTLIWWRCPIGCGRTKVIHHYDTTVLPPVKPVIDEEPAPTPDLGGSAPVKSGPPVPPVHESPAPEREEEPTQQEHPVANITPSQEEAVFVSVNNCAARYRTLLLEKFLGSLSPVEYWLLFVDTRFKTDLENLPATSKEVHAMRAWQRKNVSLGLNGMFSDKDWPLFAKGWIHANMITYSNGFRIVLSQAPQTENSTRKCNIGHFWSAVRSRGSNMVVCLTKFMEGDDEKCSPYFPLTQGTTETYANGIVTITCISVTTSFDGELTIRELRITIGNGQPFTVRHFHYTGWPDFEIPRRSDVVLAIYQEIIDRGNTPFVHCTAGLGRSGVLAQLLGNMISFESRGYHLEQTVVLNEIRHFRPGAVQTQAQLWFAAVLTIEAVRIRVGVAMTAKALKIYGNLIVPAKEYLAKGVTDATFKAIDAKLTSKNHMTDKQKAEEMEKKYKQTVLELKAAQTPPPATPSASSSSNVMPLRDNNEMDIQMLEQEVSAMRTATSDTNVGGPSRLSREAPISQQKSKRSKTPDTKEKKKKDGKKKKAAAAEAGMTVAESLGTQPSDTNVRKL